jgi:hypothetical protein
MIGPRDRRSQGIESSGESCPFAGCSDSGLRPINRSGLISTDDSYIVSAVHFDVSEMPEHLPIEIIHPKIIHP